MAAPPMPKRSSTLDQARALLAADLEGVRLFLEASPGHAHGGDLNQLVTSLVRIEAELAEAPVHDALTGDATDLSALTPEELEKLDAWMGGAP